jgi:transposase-like protein
MPKYKSMTDEQKAQAIQFRSEGISYVRIAAKIGTSESAAFKFLKSLLAPPTPKPDAPITKAAKPSKPKATLASYLPPHEFHHVASCPMRRRSMLLERRTYTRSELTLMLEEAVRNTARLSAKHITFPSR